MAEETFWASIDPDTYARRKSEVGLLKDDTFFPSRIAPIGSHFLIGHISAPGTAQ